MYLSHFVLHAFINGHLDCPQLLAIINNAVVNMGVQRTISDFLRSVLLGINVEGEWLDPMVIMCLTF